MADALASSIIERLLALELGATGQDASNRFSLDGVTLRSTGDGALEIMAGRIALSLTRAETPRSLKRVVIGAKTAREINWVK